MKMKSYYFVGLLATFLAVGCGETLEDTYSEFAGDGVIRYLGKCSELDVQPGWERLRVTWKNNLDAAVKQVKITWQSENEKEPFEKRIDRKDLRMEGLDTAYLSGLGDCVYRVRVSNVSDDGAESLVEERSVRPYTMQHEDLRSFTRGISNFFRVKDKVVVILDEDNENLKEMKLCFWGTDGKEYAWDIKEHMTDSIADEWDDNIIRDYMFVLPEEEGIGIDFTKDMVVKREGKLNDCLDIIHFNDEKLDFEDKIWSPAFSYWLNKTYGPDWRNKVDKIETVELDYDMSTFQDLLYFPNLKKVILGKNRYMVQGHTTENVSLTDSYKALVTLQFLKTLAGVETERYNTHFLNGEIEVDGWITNYRKLLQGVGKIEEDLVTEKQASNLENMPTVTLLDTTGWEVTCSDTTFNGYKKEGAAWLLQVDKMRVLVDPYGYYKYPEYEGIYWWWEMKEAYFQVGQQLSATVYEVKFDMKTPRLVQGFQVVQSEGVDLAYLLSSVKVEVSEDGYAWTNATYEDGAVTIGNALGETTFIQVPDALQKRVRYVRLTMASKPTDLIGSNPTFRFRMNAFVPYGVN